MVLSMSMFCIHSLNPEHYKRNLTTLLVSGWDSIVGVVGAITIEQPTRKLEKMTEKLAKCVRKGDMFCACYFKLSLLLNYQFLFEWQERNASGEQVVTLAPVWGLPLLGLAAQQNCIPILILINDLLQHMLQKYAERVGGYIENLSLRLKIRNGLAETSVIGPIKSVGSQARPGAARPGRWWMSWDKR